MTAKTPYVPLRGTPEWLYWLMTATLDELMRERERNLRDGDARAR